MCNMPFITLIITFNVGVVHAFCKKKFPHSSPIIRTRLLPKLRPECEPVIISESKTLFAFVNVIDTHKKMSNSIFNGLQKRENV